MWIIPKIWKTKWLIYLWHHTLTHHELFTLWLQISSWRVWFRSKFIECINSYPYYQWFHSLLISYIYEIIGKNVILWVLIILKLWFHKSIEIIYDSPDDDSPVNSWFYINNLFFTKNKFLVLHVRATNIECSFGWAKQWIRSSSLKTLAKP